MQRGKKIKNIEVKGLMTILPFWKNKKRKQKNFTETKIIQEKIEKIIFYLARKHQWE